MDKIYKACADASRRKILRLLRERDMTAGEIAANFGFTKPTLSRHFAVLREAGLIQDAKSGRSITYRLNASVLENALLSLMQDYDFIWMPAGDITSVARDLVDSLVREDFESVMHGFDSDVLEYFSIDKLAEAWQMTIDQFGPYVKQIDARTERFWKFTAVFVTCEFAKSKLDIKVTFNRSGTISGLWFLKAG